MPSQYADIIALCEREGCSFRENEPMRDHTSFKIGGPADLFLIPNSLEQLERLLPAVRQAGCPLSIIGRGSNLLVSDDGVRGVVLALTSSLSGMELTENNVILCQAGASLDALCRFALEQELSGLEFAFGIPGSVGGAVYMNAGAYGGEIKDVIRSASHIDADGKLSAFTVDELDLSYRHSRYTDSDACIVSAAFALSSGDPEAIRARMEELKARRRQKQPLEYPSAGSTFKRPQGSYASALIDQCGLKGYRVGGAMVSEKHAGFLINYDHASCAEMLTLIEDVKRIVKERTGYSLECEVKTLGI